MGTKGVGAASPTLGDGTARAIAVRRQRLLSLLDYAQRQPLALIVAPAGYGKTSLLSQWADAHSESLVTWLTIAPHHNVPGTLAHDLRRMIDTGAGTVVLDDFHRITEAVALDEVAALLEHLPPNHNVVVATRVDPPHRFYRLRLSDALTEVRAPDLAFTHEEAAEFLERADGVALSTAQVDVLLARTQGWPIALAFAADTVREGQPIEGFSSDDGRFIEFLSSEILDEQTERTRQFLLSTSVLRMMTGALCDFVTDDRGSLRTLDELAAGGVPVSSPNPRDGWVSYHPLFGSVLRRQLRVEDAALEPLLLHRAAEWHFGRGEVSEAVDYLVEAGEWDAVIEAAFTYGPAMFDEHRATEVAYWIQQLPPTIRRRRADALLLEAAVMLFGRVDPSGLRNALEGVEELRGVSAGERVVADLLRSFFALVDGSHTEAASAAERVLGGVGAVAGPDLPNVLGLTGSVVDVTAGALVAHGVACMYDGQLAAARRNLEAVADESHGVWQASALGALALVEAWSGNLSHGEALGSRSLAIADELGHDSVSRVTAWLALALVARERGEFEQAASLLEQVEQRGGTRRRVVAIWVATERAHLALAEDRAVAGRAVLAGPQASLHPSLPSGVLARRRAAEAEALMASGDLDAADEVLKLGFSAETSDVRAARVRLALERGDAGTAHALMENWPAEPQPRAGRERRLWLAILDHLDGREAEACDAMTAVVGEADIEGDVGLFEAAGNFALGPARALYRSAPTAFLRALVDRPMAARPPKAVKGLAEQLTDREFMVLVHLPSRQSNAEVADRLDVSLNTVKTHLKHIYRKLDVAGRSEAVEAAERLHLL